MAASRDTIRSCQNYVWNTDEGLGKGATGDVFRARHKETGYQFAVKTTNPQAYAQISEQMRKREYDVLRKLDHENIVKLIAVETDTSTKQDVIIMELCNGSSLHHFLLEPENHYGLEEKEFISVLKSLAAGMKHLRQQHIVHRDIKPLNIMRYITEDGRSIYKLIDFGGSRDLPQGAPFQTIVGTPGYLHPDMFDRSVEDYSDVVDLWSIGCTLFHAATGRLPFIPFGPHTQQNYMSPLMLKMTKEKQPGVISGIERTKGKIEYSTTLPPTCRLSDGLKDLITPLIAGLLESDREKIIEFDGLFQMVEDIVGRKVIHVFCANDCKSLHVYCKQNAKLADLQKSIAQQTSIAAENQLLVYENHPLEKIVSESQEIKCYPTTALQFPIYLFVKNRSADAAVEIPKPRIPMVNEWHESGLNFENLIKSFQKDSLYLRKVVMDIIVNQQLMSRAKKMFQLILSHDLKRFQGRINEFSLRVEDVGKRITLFTDSQFQLGSVLREVQKSKGKESSDCLFRFMRHGENFAQLKQDVDRLSEKANELSSSADSELTLTDKNECVDQHNCVAIMDTWLAEIRRTIGNVESAQQKLKSKNPSYAMSSEEDDDKVLTLDKKRLTETMKKTREKFPSHCQQNLKNIFDSFSLWYRQAQEVQSSLDELKFNEEQELYIVRNMIETLDVDSKTRKEKIAELLKSLDIHPVPLSDMIIPSSIPQPPVVRKGSGKKIAIVVQVPKKNKSVGPSQSGADMERSRQQQDEQFRGDEMDQGTIIKKPDPFDFDTLKNEIGKVSSTDGRKK